MPSVTLFDELLMEESFNQAEWEACLKVLNALKDNPFQNPDNQTFKTLITSIHKQAKKLNKKGPDLQEKAEDLASLGNTSIVANAQNKTTLFSHIDVNNITSTTLNTPRGCYCCGEPFTSVHFFYHKLCPACADHNYRQRGKNYNLQGYNVVITGGRVKIGYAAVLKFLRAGARVIVTTRFPALALEQLGQEPDHAQWKDNLTVYGLDLRNLKAVQHFIDFCQQHFDQLDILVNNAAQTIKYPFDYYKPLVVKENKLLPNFKAGNLIQNETPLSYQHDSLLLNMAEEHPANINRFGQPVDHRDKNSWNSTLTEIDLGELLEVNLINHISPYQLISGLKPLMLKSDKQDRFVVNVTSSEGQFSYANKNMFHPHTNMTKAALNMLTRTSAEEFIKDSIFMTSVDVGWISTGAVETKREKQFDELKIPPLDPVDGAARILHPIDEVLSGDRSLYGVLLKNYKVVDW